VDIARSLGRTAAEVIANIVKEDAFDLNALNDEEFIASLYKYILRREPDAAGLASWLKALDNYATRKAIIAGIVNSDEFARVCASLGIDPGRFASDEIVDNYRNVAQFVARLYRIALNRKPDLAGLTDWVRALVYGNSTAADIVNGFFHSPEFTGNGASDEDFIRMAYLAILGREPEAAGAKAWSDAIRNGASRDKVIRGFIGSREFRNLTEFYGIVLR
jgi:hypothetical protein